MKSGIYQIVNVINGKRYIGSSNDIKRRFTTHKYKLNKNDHSNKHLQASWGFYHVQAFRFYVIEYCSPELLFEREQMYLDICRPEYNIATDAFCPARGIKLTDVHKEQLRIINIDRARIIYRISSSNEIKQYPSIMAAKRDGFHPSHTL